MTVAFSLGPESAWFLRQLSASDWPQLRGSNGDAVATGETLADHWRETGPPILWERELGEGYSSFAVRGNRAFTMYQTLWGQYVVALDGASGKTVWETRCDWPFEGGGLYPGPRSTPTLWRDAVFYATPSGTVGCLDAATGSSRWSIDLCKTFQVVPSGFGCAASPLVADNLLIMPLGGKNASVVALDASTGQIIWAEGDEPASFATGLVVTLDKQSYVAIPMQNAVVIHDLRSGRLVWKQSLSHGYDEHSASLLYDEPHLLLSGPFHSGATQYVLQAGFEPSDRATRWFSKKLSNSTVLDLPFTNVQWRQTVTLLPMK